MTFEDFKAELEIKLKRVSDFELQEYQYLPYHMGSGLLVYRIKGKIRKLSYDGREKEIEVQESLPHEKYSGKCTWTEKGRFYELDKCSEQVLEVITSK